MSFHHWLAAGQTLLALLLVCLLAQSAMALPLDATRIVTQSALKYSVPVPFALAIAWQETRTQCGTHNKHSGAVGPLQVMPRTARHLGFKNIRAASCATQTDAGMAHLAYCLERSKGDRRAAARCHYGGGSKTWSKGKAVNAYANRVMKHSRIANNEN